MNRCYFTGRTTQDIELRYTQGKNTAVAKFGFAVDTGYGNNRKTSFFNMTAWEKTAENLSRFVQKGTKLLLECEAVQNKYTDKSGNNVNTVDFTVISFEFAESRKQKHNDDNWEKEFEELNNVRDEELPFR